MKHLRSRGTCLAVLIALAALLQITGCGGGGGGSTSSGTGVDPVEVEVQAALNSFLSAVSKNDTDGAMSWVDSNLKYQRGNPTSFYGISEFRNYLTEFLNGATGITIEVKSPGITPDGENSAIVRGSLVCHYIDNASQSHDLVENVEFGFERVAKWGILRLSGFNLAGLAFPPVP